MLASSPFLFVMDPVSTSSKSSNGDGKRIGLTDPEFARMHGYTVEELIGKIVEDMFAPEEKAGLKVHLQRVIDEGNHSFESKHIRKDGSIFPVEIQSDLNKVSGQRTSRKAGIRDICFYPSLPRV